MHYACLFYTVSPLRSDSDLVLEPVVEIHFVDSLVILCSAAGSSNDNQIRCPGIALKDDNVWMQLTTSQHQHPVASAVNVRKL